MPPVPDKWTTSRELLARAQRSLAGGVSSPFRVKAPVPLYFRNGCGARLEDVDGNEYIDYVLAWGPMILGYRHPAIVEAIRRQAALPSEYGAQAELEFLAQARSKKGMAGGEVANSTENFVAGLWNDFAALEQIVAAHDGRIAAVAMEPVLCNSGCIPPRAGYLAAVRELCTRRGILLLFDEVITGFRLSLGGAQQFYGVTPDLATFGKAVGGGAPLSGVAGRREILMQMYEGVAFGGSFNGNPVSLASSHATLTELSRNNGAALAHANAMGERLMSGIRDMARRNGIPLVVSGFGAAFALHFTPKTELNDYRDTLADDSAMLQRFLSRALEEGLHVVPDGRMYVSTAHTPRDIDETLTRLEAVFVDLK